MNSGFGFVCFGGTEKTEFLFLVLYFVLKMQSDFYYFNHDWCFMAIIIGNRHIGLNVFWHPIGVL